LFVEKSAVGVYRRRRVIIVSTPSLRSAIVGRRPPRSSGAIPKSSMPEHEGPAARVEPGDFGV